MIQILIIKLKRIKYIELDQKNEIAGIPLFEKQIIAILKENNTISNDKGDKNIILVISFEILIAFDIIFNYRQLNLNLFIINKSSKLKPNYTYFNLADNNIMNRKRESNNNIINIEALYFNKFDF
ncbi:hypothetical protein RhiirC2_858622 [Rhizophagus irregularis]|uniref:Uncharacterized protein n=1 Tax=Rhizophagus irregularis TaxID=588596 RepID=A0A2N1M424_9GLOM|nr:hypothetical protein RhiirC2_858622 [Rhizophagus irregularis]